MPLLRLMTAGVACCSVSAKSNLGAVKSPSSSAARLPFLLVVHNVTKAAPGPRCAQVCRSFYTLCGSDDAFSERLWQSICEQRWEGKLDTELCVGKRWALQHPTHQHARATCVPAHSHTRTNMNADTEPCDKPAQATNKPKP